jgi:hypothetical protein
MYVQDYDETLPLIYVQQYGNDPSGWFYAFGLRTYTWQNLVQPYVKNWGAFICPDSGMTKSTPPSTEDPFENYGMAANSMVNGITSYVDYWWNTSPAAWNGLGGCFKDSGAIYSASSGYGSATLASVASPASMTLVSEAGDEEDWTIFSMDNGFPYPTGECVYWSSSPPTYFDYNSQYRGGAVLANHQINGSGSNGKWCWQWEASESSATCVVSFLDGHSKAMNTRQFYSTKLVPNGAGQQRVLQYLWPNY